MLVHRVAFLRLIILRILGARTSTATRHCLLNRGQMTIDLSMIRTGKTYLSGLVVSEDKVAVEFLSSWLYAPSPLQFFLSDTTTQTDYGIVFFESTEHAWR